MLKSTIFVKISFLQITDYQYFMLKLKKYFENTYIINYYQYQIEKSAFNNKITAFLGQKTGYI